MPYSLCDMDCDQDINKSELEEHCSDCLCTSGLEDLGQQDVPATKAWRPTSVVEERDRLKTLSSSLVSLKVNCNRNVLGHCLQRNGVFPESVLL